MKKAFALSIVVAVVLAAVAGCAPTTVTVPVERTVEVEKMVEVEVEVTRVVAGTPVIEVVTATPEEVTGSPTLKRAREEGVIVIGTISEPPSAYVDPETNEFAGADVEIAEYIFNELGIPEVYWVLVPWDGLIPGVVSGRTDGIAICMANNPQRAEMVSFTNPYWLVGAQPLVPKGNPYDIHSMQDIAEKPVIVGGTTGAFEVEMAKEYIPEDEWDERIRTYGDKTLEMTDLAAGRIDVSLPLPTTGLKWIIDTGNEDNFELATPWEIPPGYVWAESHSFRHEDEELRQLYNEVLERMKADGTLAEILERNGIPTDGMAPLCAEDERGCAEYWSAGGQ